MTDSLWKRNDTSWLSLDTSVILRPRISKLICRGGSPFRQISSSASYRGDVRLCCGADDVSHHKLRASLNAMRSESYCPLLLFLLIIFIYLFVLKVHKKHQTVQRNSTKEHALAVGVERWACEWQYTIPNHSELADYISIWQRHTSQWLSTRHVIGHFRFLQARRPNQQHQNGTQSSSNESRFKDW